MGYRADKLWIISFTKPYEHHFNNKKENLKRYAEELMMDVPVFRQGRTIRYPVNSFENSSKCWQFFATIFAIGFLIFVPAVIYSSERNHRDLLLAFSEMGDEIQSVSPDELSEVSIGNIVHISSYIKNEDVPSPALDPDFIISPPGVLKMTRNTEYCQWEEFTHCSRICHGQECDENNKCFETDCEEICSFSYVKSWRKYHINSFFFDQPVAHHNPSRDPYPYREFVASNLHVGDYQIEQSVIKKIRASTKLLDFTIGGIPQSPKGGFLYKFFSFGQYHGPENIYTSSIDYIREKISSSEAYQQNNFVYIGNGYFFSPYEPSASQQVLKKVGEWFEGSLFDYQIGDLVDSLLGLCTAGDIRVSYHVQSPSEISILASIDEKHRIVPWISASSSSSNHNNYEVALLHEGFLTPQEMMDVESAEQWWFVVGLKMFYILWAYVLCLCIDNIQDNNNSYKQVVYSILNGWPWFNMRSYSGINEEILASNWDKFILSCAVAGVMNISVDIVVWRVLSIFNTVVLLVSLFILVSFCDKMAACDLDPVLH